MNEEIKERQALICEKWPLKFYTGLRGGHFRWFTEQPQPEQIGYNALCQEWLFSGAELSGLRVFEPFGGLGIATTIIHHLLNPASDHVCEIDMDCLYQLEHALDIYPHVTVEYGDAKETLLNVDADIYLLDWSFFTIKHYDEWEKQFVALTAKTPRAFTMWDRSTGGYFHQHRKQYAVVLDAKIESKDDYHYALSNFMWQRHGYSITQTAFEPSRRRGYLMFRPVPPREIETYTIPREAVGFRFLD
jgi:hypothetical protein